MAALKVPSRESLRALDTLNIFLADVRDGVGPYLAIYLLTVQQWDPASIGVAMSAMGIASVAAQTPCGILIDTLNQKRLLTVLASLFVGIGCTALTFHSSFEFVLGVQLFNGIAAAIFPPAVAAITLGLVGPNLFPVRMGRNEALNHAGNVLSALLAGIAGHVLGVQWIFFLVSAMAVGSMVSVLFIRERDIDHGRARAAASNGNASERISGLSILFRNRTLLIFALSTALFHFANAAMLPLAGQLLSRDNPEVASLSMSACIIAAQIIMIPVAAAAGRLAGTWGRRPVFLIGFAVLPIRGLLYTLSDAPLYIVAVQLLDGIGAGIFGVLWVTVVADLMKGTGRYNFALGAIATAQSIGAALSNLAAGYVVGLWGYGAGFLMLATAAVVALLLFVWKMPETGGYQSPAQ
ncbi:MFS transporter [Nitrospira sp. KM1]|uniref:MFS transporter n=1 Tax=Nitrospira sp. KM1 TaxID=1936990 RepID=UPI0013A761E4|nr:MFS transporter [Nitrospira sp. KM1]BCA53924.1 MFS transporter [Nitrospira sp. KM1]